MARLLFLLPIFFLNGCSTAGYYMEAINGHFELMANSRPIEKVITENNSVELTDKLLTFQQARKFAIEQLLLPDNESYTEYADIGRPYAVWNVIAAPKLSVEPKQWCFLFVGCISYRGYFKKQDAENYARELQIQGYDVYVAGARAYSTLGWFDDPLLNTMMYKSEAARVGILFHELAHQKIYIDNNSAFNEAFATTIEQEGVQRWFIENDKHDLLYEYKAHIKRRDEFNELLSAARKKLNKLYLSKQPKELKLQNKNIIFNKLKEDYKELKANWDGYAVYDTWMNKELNNAHLAIVATYHKLVPKFMQLLRDNNNNFEDFYKSVNDLTDDEIKHF